VAARPRGPRAAPDGGGGRARTVQGRVRGPLARRGRGRAAAVVAVRCWLGRLRLRREDVRCYAMAPPRCMSLGLAVEYADVVHSIVLQASPLSAKIAAS
jgi:hypothetical protein